ncbi:MAG: pantetheine-phosphate adenylyltransferase [Actinomycetes bacterium]
MRRAVCPGSFDPVTLGHLDIIARTAELFDEVVVAVGQNTSKRGLFTPEERVGMLREACSPWRHVAATVFDGLLVDFCAEREIGTIVKGLRFAADFDYELQMAQMNARMTRVETVFLPTAAQWGYLSSSLIREIASLGGDVSGLLPAGVAARVRDRVGSRLGTDPASG